MANTLVQFRADEMEKAKATVILDDLGLDLPSYLRMCVSRLVRDNGIPFSMRIERTTPNKGVEAMRRASRIAQEKGIADMTLEEINAEIAAVRNAR